MGETDSGISYATWQDRQLALILARTGDLLRELRAANQANLERNEATVDVIAASRTEELSRELERISKLLESRESELRKTRSDAQLWEAKAGALDRQLKQQDSIEKGLRAGQQKLQSEVARLSALEARHVAEIQSLTSRANAVSIEAANLRRWTAELQNSLSWKITAPLRFLTKPLFKALAPTPQPPAPASWQPAPAALPETVPQSSTAASIVAPVAAAEPADPFAKVLEAVLPELRKAASVAIIPCAIPFSSTLNQRPISCARYLADHGATVLYVAWQWSPGEAVPQAGEEVYPHVLHVPLYAFLNHVQSIATASYAKSTYFCTLPSPSLVEVVRPLRAAGYHIHYDIMDDWEGFHRGGEAPWFSAPVEQEIVNQADTVTAVSEKLVRKFSHLRSDIALVRNGYLPSALGCEQFIAARTPLGSRKIVGYFGHFSDAWFDWDTVIHAAKTLPDVDFEMIGWAVSEPTRRRLEAVSNLRLVGIVPQKELHRYARKWWLGIIPFQPTQVSEAVDPLKIYEYLHLGLPSVVTGIPGIAEFPLVQFVEGKESFVAAIRNVQARPDEQLLSKTAEFLEECVWDERFAKITAMIEVGAGLASLYQK